MINAFIPGPASIKDKRAHISMDFLSYSQRTGFNFNSSQFVDSGYASSFNVSPVISDSSAWTQSPITFTSPASFDDATRVVNARSSTSATKKSTASSSRQQPVVDFANHPGMRIMTKDGRDVTNSASRGCKTKEQRDHAHLMRIIKACDACRKRKVRCDPSHKKRAASHTSPAATESKPTKKQKKEPAEAAPPPAPVIVESTPELLVTDNFENFDLAAFAMPSVEGIENADDLFWNQYLNFDQDAFPDFALGTFDQFAPSQELFYQSTSSSSATSPSQVFTPETPVHTRPSPAIATEPVISTATPALPYLNPGVPHGTEYVDFNLYSPPADFSLDEELLGPGQPQSYAPFNTGYAAQQYVGDASVVAHRTESRSSPSSPSVSSGVITSSRLPLEAYSGLDGSGGQQTSSYTARAAPDVQISDQPVVQQPQQQQPRRRQLASGNETRVITQASAQDSSVIISSASQRPASPALNVQHAPHGVNHNSVMNADSSTHVQSPVAYASVNAGVPVATQQASFVVQQSRPERTTRSSRLRSPVQSKISVAQQQKQGYSGLSSNFSTTSRDVSSGSLCPSSASDSALRTTTMSTTTTILPGRQRSAAGDKKYMEVGQKPYGFSTSASSSSVSFPLVVLGLVSCLVVTALRSYCNNNNWNGPLDLVNTLFIASIYSFSLWQQQSSSSSRSPITGISTGISSDTGTTRCFSVHGPCNGSTTSRQARKLVAKLDIVRMLVMETTWLDWASMSERDNVFGYWVLISTVDNVIKGGCSIARQKRYGPARPTLPDILVTRLALVQPGSSLGYFITKFRIEALIRCFAPPSRSRVRAVMPIGLTLHQDGHTYMASPYWVMAFALIYNVVTVDDGRHERHPPLRRQLRKEMLLKSSAIISTFTLYMVVVVVTPQALGAAINSNSSTNTTNATDIDTNPPHLLIAVEAVSACNCPNNCNRQRGSPCKFYGDYFSNPTDPQYVVNGQCHWYTDVFVARYLKCKPV
ncbi:hypothetical protein B0T20DRAFT_394731 [Sordaria brevicollis]|uniref:Uncharacterized protein n=1 Tax=Sordaria brevicollis TaxID=83679 RepID=A0AAE0PA62_SORBR|nr:hypothetical protein B0T20DRAFT_394731 [Sordaria brevicollis]